MKYLKMLALVAVTAAGLLAVAGTSTAAAAKTTLCTEKTEPCPEAKTDGVGTEIKMNLVPGTKSKLTTEFKTVECGKSSLTAKVTSTGEKINASVESLTFEECNCEVKLLTKGTLELSQISGTANGTLRSSGTELTLQCNGTIFGNIHCIYKTEATDLGTMEGGNPAKLIINVRLIGPATNALCYEFEGGELVSQWEAEYEITSPKPLFIEGEGAPAETVLCTEKASPCPSGKADGVGTEIKASLVSGTKSKFTTIYNNIECGKTSLTAKVTSVGKTIGSSVEGLSFEECNCEVKVLSKGTLELAQIVSTTNATAKSTGAEITTLCSTVEGSVHCIYKTEATDIGSLEGGNPAKIKISSASIPRLTTSPRCAEGETAKWDVEYEVTSPKPLYAEPELAADGTVLCTEKASPCPAGKSDGSGTEIKASLVSGTKSKLTTPYNNIECSKTSLTAKVTSTGEKIGSSVESLTFEECNCEVKVLSKGTLELARIVSTENATVTSTNTEVTTVCSTITGNVHCIYKTSASDLGALEGGNPAKIKVSSAEVPRLSTDTRCNEGSAGTKWDVEYEVTSPKPLFIEPK